jgi:hypothetical protein
MLKESTQIDLNFFKINQNDVVLTKKIRKTINEFLLDFTSD